MYLIIIADTILCETGYSIDHYIMDMVKDCANIQQLQIHIISSHPTLRLKDYCNEFEHIKLITLKEAKTGMKQYQNAVLVHFGFPTSQFKGIPHFFLPLTTPNEIKGSSFVKRYLLKRQFEKWLEKATKVISFNDWSLHQLLAQFPTSKVAVKSLYLPIKEALFVEWSEMSATKEIVSKGNNYLLIFAGVENLTHILKEFSVFKKWQQSTMHLVFILDNDHAIEKANTILRGYKFKQDISLYTSFDVNENWLAASYLTIFQGATSSSCHFVLQSIQQGVPLLLDEQIQLPETWKLAGEVFTFAEKNALSNHFKLYYKDEVYRQSRAKMGSDWLQNLHQNRRAFELFNNIVLSHIK